MLPFCILYWSDFLYWIDFGTLSLKAFYSKKKKKKAIHVICSLLKEQLLRYQLDTYINSWKHLNLHPVIITDPLTAQGIKFSCSSFFCLYFLAPNIVAQGPI